MMRSIQSLGEFLFSISPKDEDVHPRGAHSVLSLLPLTQTVMSEHGRMQTDRKGNPKIFILFVWPVFV